MKIIGELIANVVSNVTSSEVIAKTRKQVAALTEQFPLYAWKRELAAV